MILDKATEAMAKRKFDEMVASLGEKGRVLSDTEAAGVMQKCKTWALQVKATAATLEAKEQTSAEVLATALDDGMADFKVNPNYVRMVLAGIGKSLGYNVHQSGTRGENAKELEINLDDELSSELDALFGAEDADDLTMEFLTTKENRSRDVTKGTSARPKVEDDPVFQQIKAAIPTLAEVLQGEIDEGLDAGRVAVKAFKHCVRSLNGMAYTKLKL